MDCCYCTLHVYISNLRSYPNSHHLLQLIYPTVMNMVFPIMPLSNWARPQANSHSNSQNNQRTNTEQERKPLSFPFQLYHLHCLDSSILPFVRFRPGHQSYLKKFKLVQIEQLNKNLIFYDKYTTL